MVLHLLTITSEPRLSLLENKKEAADERQPLFFTQISQAYSQGTVLNTSKCIP